MNPMKILLVDDSKSARYALRLQLQRHGAVVETADSAEAALERIREAPPDAVFMDHTMPGMNGFEALEIIKGSAATASIPVIMCTSSEDPDFVVQAHRKGALDVLTKSTAADKLPRLIDRLQDAAAAPPPSQPTIPATAHRLPGLAEAVSAIARQEVDRLIAQRLDSSLEQRVRTLLAPMLADQIKRLRGELSTQADARIGEHFEAETKRLQNHFIAVQSEQAHLSSQRIVNEVVPRAVIKQMDEERQSLAQMVQDLIDRSLEDLAEDPAFLGRMLASAEATASEACREAVKRYVQHLDKDLAVSDADLVADTILQATRSQTHTVYLVAVASGLVGIAAAVAVYLLLA